MRLAEIGFSQERMTAYLYYHSHTFFPKLDVKFRYVMYS